MRFSACLPVVFVLFVFLIGCSNGGSNPVMPGDTGLEGLGLTSGQMGTSGMDSNQQHFPLFAYRLNYDPATNSIEAVLDRDLYAHINVTPWLNPPNCTDCLQIFPIDSDPDAGWIELYVAVRNPFDTIGGYDARIILDAQVDGYGVVNPDGWTELFDQGGFERNPFFALSIEHPERYFAPSSQHARQFYFYYPPGGFSMDDFYVTVEISWPGNCEEPYEIVDINVENTAIPLGGNPVTVSCRVHSWFDDVESVTARIEAEGDTTPLYTLDLTHEGPGSDLWFGDISLPVGTMPPGDYKLWFETHGAYDPTISMWQVRNIEVTTDYTAWDGIANTFGGEYDDAANEVAVDDFGNVYVAGFFGGTVDFDGEDGPQLPRETHAGLDFDAYLIKYAPTGVIEWINTWGGYSSDYANGIAVDSDNGYVYVVGEFGGQVYFEDGNPDSVRLSSGGLDAYVVKYDLVGDYVDVRVLGGSGTDTGKDVTLDNENNIFIGGAIEDTAWFDDVSTALTSKGGKDAFVAKLRMDVDATMYVEWAKSWGSDYNELTLGVASNSNGDVYVTGYFQDVVNFNPGMTPVVFESNGGSDVFLTKYNQGGSHRWTEVWGGGNYDSGFSVVVQDDQYVYVTGYFKEDIEIGTSGLIESEGYADIFLVKWHDVAGFHSYEWLRTWGYERWAQGISLAVDGSDYIYMTGRYNDIVDPGPDERRVAFLRKIEAADGDEDWVSDWGGPYADCWAEGASVAVDLNGYPYVAGWYLGTIDFDSGPMDEFHTSNGQMDAFVTRFDSTFDRADGGLSEHDHRCRYQWDCASERGRGLA